MTGKFTNPFRYIPSEDSIKAAELVMQHIRRYCNHRFDQGKMLGVLIIDNDSLNSPRAHYTNNGKAFLAGYSGAACNDVSCQYYNPECGCTWFVPEIFDICSPQSHFKQEEAQISSINKEIARIKASKGYLELKQDLERLRQEKEERLARERSVIAQAKKSRQAKRSSICSNEELDALIKESQFEKAEFKRLKSRYELKIGDLESELDQYDRTIKSLTEERKTRSDALQEWTFKQYKVLNADGKEDNILDIFLRQGLTPPAATGDCAGPKLLQFAYIKGLKPVSMGEFWYGKSGSLRLNEHFYPSCTHRCGPLLGYMLEGLDYREDETENLKSLPPIIYEDEHLVAAVKGFGELSMPGKNGTKSLFERLERHYGKLYPVHRLDMDTSGVIIFAKDNDTQKAIQRQFEEEKVAKTYIARLCPPEKGLDNENIHKPYFQLAKGQKGCINLAISENYADRPRQMVDWKNGKTAITFFEVLEVDNKGRTLIKFRPTTGKTHQLRIHSAHPDGLCRPIVGDRLYGGCTQTDCSEMELFALDIEITLPKSGQKLFLSARKFCQFTFFK